MNRGLLVLIPWMATLAAANPNGPRPAQVCFTHVGPTHERAWKIGDECWVPLAALKTYGWRYSINRSAVEITSGERRILVGFRPGSKEELVPLREAVRLFGGVSNWRPNSSTLDVFALIESVTLEGDRLSVATSLAAKPKVFGLGNPARIVVDVEGAQIGPATTVTLPPHARIGQYKPSVVRITIETDHAAPARSSSEPTGRFALTLGGDSGPEVVQPPVEDPGTPEIPPEVDDPKIVGAGPLQAVKDTETQAIARIPLAGKLSAPPKFRRVDLVTLEITLPKVRFQAPGPEEPAPAPFSKLETRRDGDSTVVTLTLPRPMGVSFAHLPSEVQLALYKPVVGNGKLAGKLVVVDPGHGGTDTGAKSRNGAVREKDLNLKIAKTIADRLASQGATVILTRKTDVKIALKERSEIANRNSADLFVSVHINSNRLAGSRSGNMTFHHGGDPIGNVLAQCVQREIAKTSGLPSLGVWSDTRIYTSGFAVLRYAKMPAVLLELGFINHAGDLKRMSTDDFQRKVADAVVRGLKVYLGDAETNEEEPIQ